MSDMNKQQSAQGGHQNTQQQAQQQQQAAQQQVEGQTIQVQQVQIAHDGSDQMHAQGGQVASSGTSTMVMATPQQAMLSQQAMQNLQNQTAIAPMPSQGGSTTITTMSTGPPQQMTEWPGHGRVQVIQQPIQNPTYIQPVYNAQGQLIVPGNIALHPGNMNQPIQVITAGKAFQPGQMPHMLATQGKQIVQGQATSFPSYATIPTSGNNQTLVISQLGVLGQTNILPQQQGKPQEMQKMITKTNSTNNNMKPPPNQNQNVSISNLVSSQPQGITTQAQTIIQPQILSPIQVCVDPRYTCNTQQQRTVPQGAPQTMQFAPWQATFGPTGLPQGLTWAPGAIHSSTLLTQGSQIFIRNPQHDQAGMFIQNAQPSTIPQHNQIASQPINKPNQGIDVGGTVQGKTAISKTFSAILPNSVATQNIRPASSVSTQTGQTQTTMHQAAVQSMKAGAKVRTKNVCRMPNMTAASKTDAANQTKSSTSGPVIQSKLVVSNAPPGILPGSSPDKQAKQGQTQSNLVLPQQPTQQVQGQQQQQQPLTQIQQMQNMFQEQVDQKPQPGQVMMSNGIPNGDRGVMPVVSMPPGQMAPLMGNMIVQTVPGITTMSPNLAMPAGQTVSGVPVAQEIIATPTPVPLSSAMKVETAEIKESSQETATPETGPGRPGVDTETSFEELGNAQKDKKTDKLPETNGETKDSVLEDKDSEKKANEKSDGVGTGQPKAMVMVKPQVLTHVIEGFVIQESSEPFPVNRGCVDGLLRKIPTNDVLENGEPPKKKPCVEDSKESQGDANQVNPSKWTVAEVCDFIRNLPGCADYVEDFAMQDIDGEALLLLKPDHLMSAMSMKLGPAVKIIAKIDTMRANTASKEGAKLYYRYSALIEVKSKMTRRPMLKTFTEVFRSNNIDKRPYLITFAVVGSSRMTIGLRRLEESEGNRNHKF